MNVRLSVFGVLGGRDGEVCPGGVVGGGGGVPTPTSISPER